MRHIFYLLSSVVVVLCSLIQTQSRAALWEWECDGGSTESSRSARRFRARDVV